MSDTLICGTCRHLTARPPDINNLGQKAKECREGPPQVILIPAGKGGAALLFQYPQLPDEYPACSRHEKRISLLFPTSGEED